MVGIYSRFSIKMFGIYFRFRKTSDEILFSFHQTLIRNACLNTVTVIERCIKW
jgi:hypothetical protein